MDEDYARLLRDWLLADPGAPRPRSESDDVEIPAPRLSEENRRRNAAEGRTAAEGCGPGRPRDAECRGEVEGPGLPRDPQSRSEVEGRTEAEGRDPAQARDPESRGEAEGRTETEGRGPGQLRDPECRSEVEARAEAEDCGPGQPRDPVSRSEVQGRTETEGRGPGQLRDPVSRSEVEARAEAEGYGPAQPRDAECRGEVEGRTEAEDRGPAQPRDPVSRSEAEERSRWNHPSNWHRRKAARAEIRDRVAEPEEWSGNQPDGRSRLTEPDKLHWPRRDPDQVMEPSRWSRLDEQDSWTQLDDAVNRSRRRELDQAHRHDDPENRSR
jgi:hypothetical protein